MKIAILLFLFGITHVYSNCNLDTKFDLGYRKNFGLLTDEDDGKVSDQSLSGISQYMTNYRIRFTNTEINTLCRDFVKKVPKTEGELIFDNCGILTIEVGAFKNLKGLSVLQISNNYIHEIRDRTFEGLTVYELNLENNGISYIAPDAFDGLNKVNVLTLAKNKLAYVESSWFSSLPELKYFDVMYNKITSIDAEDFSTLELGKTCNNEKHDNCPVINLSHNRIDTVDSEAFKDLKQLRSVFFDDNDLDYLPNPFDEIQVQNVSYEYNYISEIYEHKILPYANQVVLTYFYGNPFTQRSLYAVEAINKEHGHKIEYKRPHLET